MPALIGKPSKEYEKLATFESGTWIWWTGNMDICKEGWKLHVGGTQKNAQSILNLVLPVLQKLNIAHKFLPDTASMEEMTEEQAGKWFAVYPDSVLDAFAAVSDIDVALKGYKRKDVIAIPHDKAVGRTVVYTRYGGYITRKVENKSGNSVKDEVGSGFKPSWIDDPWLKFQDYANYSGNRGAVDLGKDLGKQFPK